MACLSARIFTYRCVLDHAVHFARQDTHCVTELWVRHTETSGRILSSIAFGGCGRHRICETELRFFHEAGAVQLAVPGSISVVDLVRR